MQKQLSEMHDSTGDMDTQTHELNQETKEVGKTSTDISNKTDGIVDVSNKLLVKTNHISEQSDKLYDKTAHLSDVTDGLSDKTTHLSATSDALYERTSHVASKTDQVYDLSQSLFGVSTSIDGKTAELVTAGKNVVGVLNTLLDDSKHGSTTDLHLKLMPMLLEPQEIAPRLTLAATYFRSYEFQLWSGVFVDTPEHRDRLDATGAQEFIGFAQKLYTSTKMQINPLTDNQRELALNALAAEMDSVDDIQNVMLAKHPEVKSMSMLNIIEEGLLHNKAIEAGSESVSALPPYVDAVLQDRDVAIYLLQTRYNYLSFIGIGSLIKDLQTPDSEDSVEWINLKKDLLKEHCKLTQMISPKMKANISIYSISQLKRMNLFLQNAVDTRDFLRSIDAKAELHCSAKAMISLIDTSSFRFGGRESAQRREQREKLLKLFNELEAK